MSGGFHRLRHGDAVVTVLRDGAMPFSPANLHGISEAGIMEILHRTGLEALPHTDVNCFAVQVGGRTAVIDAGGGPHMIAAVGYLPSSLKQAGIDPAEVDTVLMTHLHSDHAYGLIDADGVPVFPKAALRVAEAEAAFWLAPGAEALVPDSQRRFFPRVPQAIAAYGARLQTFTDEQVFPGVTPVPFPGHTPGHTGFRLGDGAGALLVWGDIVHVPEIQSVRPEATVAFDADPAGAIASRRRAFAMAVDEKLRILGMHTHFPGPWRVEVAEEGYAIVPE